MTSETLVHVVDDDAAMRDSLAFLLESAGLRVKTYDGGLALLSQGPLEPGCIVTDVRMPGMTGLDLVRRLNADGVDLPVVVITGHGDIPLAVEAMKEGVADFLEKPFDDDVLLDAIRGALSRHAVDADKQADARRFKAVFEKLSARERDVVSGLIAGKPNKLIAYDLGISPRTVEIYRANVMSKTAAHSLSELVRMALIADFI
jgi:two-component system response regulator FixJ